jgi:hypothetical protein
VRQVWIWFWELPGSEHLKESVMMRASSTASGFVFALPVILGLFVMSGCARNPQALSAPTLIARRGDTSWDYVALGDSTPTGYGLLESYVEGTLRILSSYEDEDRAETAPGVDLADYCGDYQSLWVGESPIVPWKGKLAAFFLRYPDQKKPDLRMVHVEGDVFRRVRDDGDLGEEIRFERNETGRVIRYWQNSQYVDRAGL